jgi:hypothetical protein
MSTPCRRAGVLAALLLLAGPAARGGPEPGELGPDWRQAVLLEREGRALERDRPEQAVERYLRAARRFESVARQRNALALPLWRGARAFWMAGDTLPFDAKEERLRRFEAADALSSRGIAVDPRCAECMLWKFASMGRLRTTRFLWSSIRDVPEMASLLDRAIALEPTYREDAGNSTLGNLHYSSAIFYRVLPDGFFIGWILGVRGDKDRALRHIRTARTLHPGRLDYEIELGSQLLCLGSVRGETDRLAEGRAVMLDAIVREPETQDDAREIAAARIMLASPRRSCGYSGDAWLELDEREARRAAGSAPR